MENDLEAVINKYNSLIGKYNNLIDTKKMDESNKFNHSFVNKSNGLFNNLKNKLTDRSNISTLNNSNEKINSRIKIYNNKNNNSQMKNILFKGNNKNISPLDNEYINLLKKENERLKKLIITYENNNSNNYIKKSANILQKRNHLINSRIKRITEKAKRSIDKTKSNSKEHSYLMNAYKNKKTQNKYNFNNQSSILFLMKQNNSITQKNNFIDYSIITDSSLIIPKNKKIAEIPKNNKIFNTISATNTNNNEKKIIKKSNTNVNSIASINNITNKRMINKLKVKCRDYLINDKANNNINNFSREKNIHKITPKNIIKNNGSFFAQTNKNYLKNKNKNKIRSFKLLEIDNNFINIKLNDFKNNTSYNYFSNNANNKNKNNNNTIENEDKNNRLNTEVNSSNNSNMIIHRNTEYKICNKFRLIKEFKTEKNDLNTNENNGLYFSNDNNISKNGLQKIKINRKNIFYKKTQNSLRNAINNNENINLNNNELNIRRKSNYQLVNKNNIIKSNNLPLDNKNNNNNFSSSHYSKDFYNDKKLSLYQNKKAIEKAESISAMRNNQIKTQNKTINNISNFNNCNYIYLFNNGHK